MADLRVVLTRNISTDQGTPGLLAYGGKIVRTIELPWRDNMRKRSSVPTGRYLCEVVRSPRFGRVYALRDVPGRSNVLIHGANFGGDESKGWQTHLQGCIAPCQRVGLMRNDAGWLQLAGLASRSALSDLTNWANGRPFILEIK